MIRTVNWPLLTVALGREEDVVTARQRARLLAERLRFETLDQARIATAVSEIARNAVSYGGGGRAEFLLVGAGEAAALEVRISDQGAGIADLDAVLEGRYRSPTGMGMGLTGTRRLMDRMAVETGPDGTTVSFARALPRHVRIEREELHGIAAAMAAAVSPDPLAELRAQNRETLNTLADMAARKDELARLNTELEDTNRGVVALYAELDEKAEALKLASELKTRFLSDMSHEFRTPLNSILALSRLLLDRTDGELGPEQERQVTYIRRSAENLTELVNDLLDLAKVEAGKVELRPSGFAVPELLGALRGVLRPLQTGEKVELRFQEGRPGPPLFTDEGKVSQILRNLVSNALKFTERGLVAVSTAYLPAGRGVPARYVFAVRDTGIGIAAADQERIFEEFTQVHGPLQARSKGTGLGLPLSRRLAELLGGTLRVESTPGRGSTFLLEIPARLPFGVATAPTPEPGAEARRVLVIDDEETARYLLSHIAASLPGMAVSEASAGEAGIRQAQAEPPDLILLDLRMPGLDGFEVLRRLKQDPATRSIPVVICTASALTPEDRRRLGAATAVLPKDAVSRDTLLAALGPAFARSGG